MIEHENLTDWHPADENHCFLCGVELISETRSEEHIFPKWLQQKLNLRDERLTLANGTLIPYRNLTVPCCKECNNVYLGRMENEFQARALDSNTSLDSIPDWLVYRWCAKVLFAILYKEQLLKAERRNPHSRGIWDKEIVNQFKELHFFLHSVRNSVTFSGIHSTAPGTIYKFNTKFSDEDNFDFLTNVYGRSVAIRIRNRGFIVVFDGGLQEIEKGHSPAQFSSNKLHPEQFTEIIAKVFYKATKCCGYHRYLFSKTGDDYSVDQLSVVSTERELLADGAIRVFQDFDLTEFAHYYAHLIGEDVDTLLGEGGYLSCLLSPTGEFQDIPI